MKDERKQTRMKKGSDKTLSAGKADINVLDRSVFRRIRSKSASSPRADENQTGSGEDGLSLSPDVNSARSFIRISIDPITVGSQLSGKLSVIEAVNGLWARGAVPYGIETVILLPEGTMESELRRIEDQIAEAVRQENIEVLGGHTEVTSAVNRPVIIGSGIGMQNSLKSEYCMSIARAGFDGHVILMTSFAGLEGSAILGFEKERELSQQFPASLVQTAREAADHLSVRSAAECLWKLSGEKSALEEDIHSETRSHSEKDTSAGKDIFLVNLSEGGFYAGLWKLAEETHCGVDVDLKKVPILQETIEIANFFDIDPYWMESAGSLLAAVPAEKAEEVLTGLAESNIPAAVIGTLNDTNQKIIRNGDEMRFLDRPQADSLRKILI